MDSIATFLKKKTDVPVAAEPQSAPKVDSQPTDASISSSDVQPLSGNLQAVPQSPLEVPSLEALRKSRKILYEHQQRLREKKKKNRRRIRDMMKKASRRANR